MKKILSLFCTFLICSLSCVLLTGCVEKTYKLVGIVDEKNDLIVYYKNLTDDKKAIIDGYEKFTIKLGYDGDLEINITTYEKPILTKYQICGTYELKGEELYFTYTFSDGTKNTVPEQYTNGRIIYFDDSNSVYLVFE